jgi:hypothetical protein
MKPLQQLAEEWLEVKNAESEATEKRRLIEDEVVRLLEISSMDDHAREFEADPFTFKITCRINRKVNGDLAQEIAAEHDMQDFLGMLFRWKPELSMAAWKGVGDNVKSVFAPAITSTPGRPSFAITREAPISNMKVK